MRNSEEREREDRSGQVRSGRCLTGKWEVGERESDRTRYNRHQCATDSNASERATDAFYANGNTITITSTSSIAPSTRNEWPVGLKGKD